MLDCATATRADARAFAEAWAAAWNRLDVEAVLAHFTDAAVFESPKALAITGRAKVDGKPALRAYWAAAVARIQTIHFTIDDVAFDAEARRLAIIYRAAINGVTTRATEHLRFDARGHVDEGIAYYSAPLPDPT